ncbi:PHP domain-containing protein [Phycisphaeraceae bacterium D3-23]
MPAPAIIRVMPYDLHMHSTASDGTDAPGDLARLVKDAGLAGFALTDHDTTSGLADAAAAAKRLRLKFVPGIELSADPGSIAPPEAGGVASDTPGVGTLHILGYHVRHDDAGLARLGERLRATRAKRNPEVVEKLQQLGVKIEYDEVLAAAGVPESAWGDAAAIDATGVIVGRPHIAQVLIAKGYVRSIHEAFAKYIGFGGAAHTRKDRLSAAEAIAAIHAAGGAAVLAHPVQLRLAEDLLEHAVARLADLGLDGIETRHSDHGPGDTEQFTDYAERFGLVTTGGSDYHGSRKHVALGSVTVTGEDAERLEAAAARHG